ncbi:unnamed protein product [Thelazia callipaeda]|uniref:TPT domain-containing protein n=1 Tax=Thelazia callipaeda TaxID=103827 RepID=A0A0N5CWL3_THECL|nr:unnamed protein product [Thelazia callipaeda]
MIERFLDDVIAVMRNKLGLEKEQSGSAAYVEGTHIWIVLAGICVYYPLSIGLTFFQKWFIKSYKLPLFVVTCHYVIKYLIAIVIRFFVELYTGKRARVPLKEQLMWLVPIGICASLDIGLSNWALEYVTVSLFTMAKSSSILFIVAFALLLRLERWRPNLVISAGLIAFGLFLFTWRSSSFEIHGLLLIELAAACTGLRWTVSQVIMQGEEKMLKHPLDMVAHVQPWMIIAILPLLLIYEGSQMSFDKVASYRDNHAPFSVLLFVSIGGFLAFAMEMAVQTVFVFTQQVLQEVVTLSLAHFINGDSFSVINTIGLFLCFSGMLLHAFSKRKFLNSRLKSPRLDRRRLLTDVDT